MRAARFAAQLDFEEILNRLVRHPFEIPGLILDFKAQPRWQWRRYFHRERNRAFDWHDFGRSAVARSQAYSGVQFPPRRLLRRKAKLGRGIGERRG